MWLCRDCIIQLVAVFDESTSPQRSVLRHVVQEKKQGWDEALCLIVHYGWYLGLVFSYLPIGKGLLFVLMTQMVCGFLLSIVFVQSHNGMEVYSTEKDFVTAQVVSTRDIAPGLWNDWFTGESFWMKCSSFCKWKMLLVFVAGGLPAFCIACTAEQHFPSACAPCHNCVLVQVD